MSEAVLLAFQAAEYWAAGQEGPSRGGRGSGRYTYESGSHYGPGETSASTLSSKQSITSSNHGRLTGEVAPRVGGRAVEAPATAAMERGLTIAQGKEYFRSHVTIYLTPPASIFSRRTLTTLPTT